MKILKSILLVFIFIFLVSCDDNTGSNIGQNAPIINTKDTNGKKVSLEKKGIEIVLFWENGCAGCIGAMPSIDEYIGGKNIKVYAINSINKFEVIKDFEASKNFSNMMILEDMLNISWNNYHVKFVPSMFIIKDGVVVEKILGDRTWSYIKPKLSKYF